MQSIEAQGDASTSSSSDGDERLRRLTKELRKHHNHMLGRIAQLGLEPLQRTKFEIEQSRRV